MEDEVVEFLHKFEQISHSRFDIRYFKKDFLKIFYSVYKEECSHKIKKELLKQLSDNFFKTLFLARDRDIKIHLKVIFENLNEESSLEKFLSKLFFVVMNYYLKSCYRSDVKYQKVHNFSSAIDEMIAWSKNVNFSDMSENMYDTLSTHDTLMSLFENKRENSEKIVLLNHYKSIPIQYPAKIIHTRESGIIVVTNALQSRAAILEGKSYILKDKHILDDLTVSVKEIDIEGKKLLELKGFDKLSNGIVKRNDVRVHTPSNSIVKLNYIGRSYNVALFDLSFGGLSLITAQQINAPKYSIFKIDFENIMELDDEIEASLIHVSRFENAFKYHFKVNFSIKNENIVTDYITNIQKAIIKELKSS